MTIKYGRLYVNKTWRFLAPSLKYYGEEFIQKFNVVMKLAVGIHDTLLDGSQVSDDNNIYVLVDRLAKPKEFLNFINFISEQEYYIDSYSYDEVVNPRKMMIILKIPEELSGSYYHFLKGHYSKMYNRQQLRELYNNVISGKSSNQQSYLDYEILSKTGENSKKLLIDTIKEEFGKETRISETDIDNLEWELPLKKKEEIFNYQENTTIFFNEKADKTWG